MPSFFPLEVPLRIDRYTLVTWAIPPDRLAPLLPHGILLDTVDIPGQGERALLSILYVVIIMLTAPFGWIAGTLSALNKDLPFMLNIALFAAGAVLAYLAGQASQKRIAADAATA